MWVDNRNKEDNLILKFLGVNVVFLCRCQVEILVEVLFCHGFVVLSVTFREIAIMSCSIENREHG